MELSVDVAKFIVLSCLLVATFFFGVVPVLIIRVVKKESARSESDSESTQEIAYHQHKLSNYKRVLSFLNCLAAGVFLATCFLDLLPSVQHNLTQVLYNIKVYTGFPVAEFVMILGLFFILLIEQIVLTVKESHHVHSEESPAEDFNDPRRRLLPPREDDEDRRQLTESYHSDYSFEGICDKPHVTDCECGWTPQATEHHLQTPDEMLDSTRVPRQRSHSVQSHHHHSNPSLQVHSPLRAMILVIALSLHSVFEGLTIGLQQSVGSVFGIFAALALHKSILSFSLGMNLVQSKIAIKSAVKSLILFSVSSPIGIAVGIVITDFWDSTSSGLVHGILQGIASGTFLYIIFFEILPKEFNNEADRLLKVLFLVLGYGAVTGILFLDDDVKSPFCVIKPSDNP